MYFGFLIVFLITTGAFRFTATASAPNATTNRPRNLNAFIPGWCTRFTVNADLPGNDIGSDSATYFEDCQRLCESKIACRAFTHVPQDKKCYFKSAYGMASYKPGLMSGIRLKTDMFSEDCPNELVFVANCDLPGDDKYHFPAPNYSACVPDAKTKGYAFTWSDYNGGTCWMKASKTSFDCVNAPNKYSGILTYRIW